LLNHTLTKPETHPAIAASMIVLSTSMLGSLYFDHPWLMPLACAAFLCFILVSTRFHGRRERFLIAVSIALTVTVWFRSPDAQHLLQSALERGVFLAAFMILLALLREGAVTSPAVLEVGTYLTRQPPSRRYLSIHLGGHLLAIILNFGALNLLGPLIMRGIDSSTTDERVAEIRKERQISALLRGFAWMVAWSPTAITQALVFAIVPGVEPVRMLTIGLVLVLLTSLAGWGFDWLTGLKARRVIPASARPQFDGSDPFPRMSFLNFLAICFFLAGATVAVILLFEVTTVPALMLVAPIVTGFWIIRQNLQQRDWPRRVVSRVKTIATGSMPLGSPEAVTLACAGYCGICAAGLVDATWFAEQFSLAQWNDLAIYAAAMLLPAILSNVGLPPLMVITFIGTLLSGLPGLDYDPTLLAMAFCVGWALNLTGSPFGVSAVIMARITNVPTRDLAWRWNGLYSLATFAISSVVLIAFARI